MQLPGLRENKSELLLAINKTCHEDKCQALGICKLKQIYKGKVELFVFLHLRVLKNAKIQSKLFKFSIRKSIFSNPENTEIKIFYLLGPEVRTFQVQEK